MLIAVNTYKEANINTSLINIVVFIPLLVLPGVTGKFLAYIPLTIFSTLLASLILALTTNGAIFTRLNKPLPYYYAESHDEDEEETAMQAEEKKILALEQVGKDIREPGDKPRLD
ncbi:efflux RND transporter permease subunit [Patescibacteria group bacterium]|nr:efflux RND transporter permease subunit [Patescibacteria group bacterium]